MAECVRATDPWKKWPNRMLRHKAAIQCARYAFGFSGIMEPDEYERMKDVTPKGKSGAERLAERKAAAEPIENQEGFSLQHVEKTTAHATRQEPETDQWDEASTVDAEPLEPAPMQQENENPDPATGEVQGHDPLHGYEDALSHCKTPEDVDALTPQFGEIINALSKEDKTRAKALRMEWKKQLEGAA
jgi:RecT family protein